MAIVLEGGGTITGVTTFTTPLDDIQFDSIKVTGIATAGTFQAGTGVSMASPRSQTLSLYTNNTEWLSIDDAGRVGIGTTNAQIAADTNNVKVVNAGIITANQYYGNQLTAAGVRVTGVSTFAAVTGTTGTFTGTVKSGTTATGTIFSAGDSGTGGDKVIQFKRAATTNDINIQAINSGSGATALLFNQEGGTASFGAAVGIGTVSPSDILEVYPDAARGLVIRGKAATSYAMEIKNDTNNTGGEIHLTGASAGGIVINRGGTETARFDGSSNFSLGNSSVAFPSGTGIQVYHATNPRIKLTNSTTGVSGTDGTQLYLSSDGDTILDNKDSEDIIIHTNASEKLRITSGGRLLVGHTASEAMFYTGLLQVQGTGSGNAAITVKTNQNDSGGPAIVLGKSRGAVGSATVVQDGDELGAIYFAGADGTDTNSRGGSIRCHVDGSPGSNDMPGRLQFFTTADGASTETERIRITSDGKVLIGTTAASRLLTLYGDSGIALQNSTTGTGTGNGSHIWASGNDLLIQNREDANIRFFTDDQEKMELQADGDLKLDDGDVIINTAGHGVLFHSHAAANNLDDYEEGTFTPVVSGNGGTAGTWSTNQHKGAYRKVGTLVFVAIQVAGVVGSAGNGNLQITGLPFTSATLMGGHGQAVALGPLYGWDITDSAFQIGARVNDNGTTIMFWNNFDDSTDANLAWPFGSSGTKYGSIAGCYIST